jgi:hypothetical protein
VEYTAENQNLVGVGVYNGQEGTQFGFRGIYSDTLALTVALDAPNNAIQISFDDELLIDDVPTFTETIRGIGEAATQAEANAGVSDNTIITPLKLGARTATETRSGLAEIATQAEVTTGTDDTTIVTPLKLATFAGTQKTTRVFADAVARAAAVPTFDGQIGSQLDNNALIIATGTVAGSFSPNIVIGGTLTVLGFVLDGSAATATFATLNSNQANFDGFTFDAIGLFSSKPISFETGTEFQINGSPAAESVIVGRTLGAADALALTEFLSSENESTGWTGFSNSAVRKTGDCNTITLPQLAQVVDTLIQVLGTAKQIPIP